MKNMIYAGLSSSTSVAVNGVIPISTVAKRYVKPNSRNSISLVGNAVAITTKCGSSPRYNVDVSVTFTGATAGDADFTLYQDGVAVAFASGTETVGTASTEYHTITFPASITVGCCSTDALTIVNTGDIGVTVYNASIRVVED